MRQLESLARERSWFGSGSVIIITTQDQHVLCKLRGNERYQPKLLNDNEAQQLFTRHVFNSLSPPQEYLQLAQEIIKYSCGLPLGLATLGSHLVGKSVTEWEWELTRLREIPNCDIQKILKISFDRLDGDIQSVFLDIACAFHGFNGQQVIEILNACGFHSEIAIATLERKCLLQWYGLVMHDLVRDMGREIVRMESAQYPGKRSRLFNPEEVLDVLQGNKCLKKLDLSSCERLRRIPNFNGLLSLEILRLCGCSSLTEIHQSIGNLDKLIELDLSQCSSLQRLSFDPGDLPSLKTLSASRTGIKQWPASVERLSDPVTLEVGAKMGLSQRVHSWTILLRRLQLNLFKADIPRDIGNLSTLEFLDLSGNRFHRLPFDISKLPRLRDLRLNNCPNLVTLPSVSDLEYLSNFELKECKKLVKITELHNLPCISRIDMVGSSSLQNLFNEGFFSAHALLLQSRKDRNLVMKPELEIDFDCSEIPDWCSNTVRASSICFTMPTHNEYKYLGMVLWFVLKCPINLPVSRSQRVDLSYSIAGEPRAHKLWPGDDTYSDSIRDR